MTDGTPLAGDLLIGAAAIAEFVYGDRSLRRKIFHLVEKTRFPHFRIGSQICARRSVVLKWIDDQERSKIDPPQPKPKPGKGLKRPQDKDSPETGAPPPS